MCKIKCIFVDIHLTHNVTDTRVWFDLKNNGVFVLPLATVFFSCLDVPACAFWLIYFLRVNLSDCDAAVNLLCRRYSSRRSLLRAFLNVSFYSLREYDTEDYN